MLQPSPIAVSPSDLRAIFNQHYHDRIARGELTPMVKKSGHPAPERSGQPFCTRSQVIEYFDVNGAKVVLVHQYLRPDGSLGASGKPDPKWLVHEGRLLIAIR